MIRRKTTLRSKSGGGTAQNGNGNGNPRALVDEVFYRNKAYFNSVGWRHDDAITRDPTYSGWANASRPRDYAIFLTRATPLD